MPGPVESDPPTQPDLDRGAEIAGLISTAAPRPEGHGSRPHALPAWVLLTAPNAHL